MICLRERNNRGVPLIECYALNLSSHPPSAHASSPYRDRNSNTFSFLCERINRPSIQLHHKIVSAPICSDPSYPRSPPSHSSRWCWTWGFPECSGGSPWGISWVRSSPSPGRDGTSKNCLPAGRLWWARSLFLTDVASRRDAEAQRI